MKESTLTIRLPRELQIELNKICREEDRSISQLVRESIKQYVAVRQFRSLRQRVLPFAEAKGLLTDEDIYNIVS